MFTIDGMNNFQPIEIAQPDLIAGIRAALPDIIRQAIRHNTPVISTDLFAANLRLHQVLHPASEPQGNDPEPEYILETAISLKNPCRDPDAPEAIWFTTRFGGKRSWIFQIFTEKATLRLPPQGVDIEVS